MIIMINLIWSLWTKCFGGLRQVEKYIWIFAHSTLCTVIHHLNVFIPENTKLCFFLWITVLLWNYEYFTWLEDTRVYLERIVWWPNDEYNMCPLYGGLSLMNTKKMGRVSHWSSTKISIGSLGVWRYLLWRLCSM